MPEFYIIIARKIFFPNFGGHVPLAPGSFTYELNAKQNVIDYYDYYKFSSVY